MIFDDKTILVTGGTGSMGRTFVRRVLGGTYGTAKKVIVFSRDEAKQHEMRISYLHKRAATDEIIFRNFQNLLEFRIGDVRRYEDVRSAIHDADIVVNAAALKQVPTCEYFPEQALMTNALGPANIVRAVQDNGNAVESVVAISTDKACKPVNVMGMTKSIQERIFIAGNLLHTKTRFIGVRYGNVLASRGSVIPLFHDQIRNGGPVTITDERMTRFLLTLEQAVDTVLAALQEAQPGEIYVPRISSALLTNVAKALIGDRDIPLRITGIRPGEKLHEILVSEEEAHHCVERGLYYVIRPMLPELQDGIATSGGLSKEFSSADVILDFAQTEHLLRRYDLLLPQASVAAAAQPLLR